MPQSFGPTLDLTHNWAPIYVQLSTLFRRFIVTGQWRVEGRIATHEDLAAQFDVNPATIRKAIAILEEEGLVRRRRRHGTFVTAKPARADWCPIGTTWDEALHTYDGMAVEVLLSRDDPGFGAAFHNPAQLAECYRLMRRLYRRGRDPLVVEESCLDRKLHRKIGDAKLARAPALPLLDACKGLRIERADETIRFGIADAEISALLKIALNAPVAIVHQSVFGPQNLLLYEARACMRGDLARISEPIKFA
jgi:GntR family transcriptional regulator